MTSGNTANIKKLHVTDSSGNIIFEGDNVWSGHELYQNLAEHGTPDKFIVQENERTGEPIEYGFQRILLDSSEAFEAFDAFLAGYKAGKV